ncbi:MAG TPA: PQQ-dependent sugar dehydrogenase, partial [Erythrobacter sp.]|nr:PQQ-dependent sugar dehydrogenase [Erythrobacter sp.]
MIRSIRLPIRMTAALSLPAMLLASCANAETGETATVEAGAASFATTEVATFEEPWAIAFAPGTPVLFVTEKSGNLKFIDTETGFTGPVSGLPEVAYGGQGGLGDIAFLPSESSDTLDRRTIYLSWAEAGEADTRGAVVGKGTLVCGVDDACVIEGLAVIWRQTPKVSGRGHYSHRLSISPDGQHLFIASGDRQKMQPAQDTTNTLGTIVRLNLDGTPAAGNPLAEKG